MQKLRSNWCNPVKENDFWKKLCRKKIDFTSRLIVLALRFGNETASECSMKMSELSTHHGELVILMVQPARYEVFQLRRKLAMKNHLPVVKALSSLKTQRI